MLRKKTVPRESWRMTGSCATERARAETGICAVFGRCGERALAPPNPFPEEWADKLVFSTMPVDEIAGAERR